MGLTYRWMQKRDLSKLENGKYIKNLLKNNRIIANVVEVDNKILGWIVYEVIDKQIQVIRFSFCNNEVLNLILSKLKNKINYKIKIPICEYDLEMQLYLRDYGFIATEIKKIKDSSFYIFEIKNEKSIPD